MHSENNRLTDAHCTFDQFRHLRHEASHIVCRLLFGAIDLRYGHSFPPQFRHFFDIDEVSRVYAVVKHTPKQQRKPVSRPL